MVNRECVCFQTKALLAESDTALGGGEAMGFVEGAYLSESKG